MRKSLPLALFGLLVASLAARCGAEAPADDRVVVMISVDGLAGFYFDDPKAEMPTIRQLAAEGARAAGMRASTPSVTWPNHTTLVTGVQPARHGVVGNNYFDRKSGKVVTLLTDPVYDKDEIVKVPTVYDLAKAAHMKTAAVIWPATRGAKTLDWTVPDVSTNELFQKYGTPSLLAECKEAGLDYEHYGEWAKAGQYDKRDDLNTGIFKLILEKHKPQLALLHLINVDHMEHGKGPRTSEAYAAVKEADAHVREVWDEIKKVYPAGRASLIIVSDHGFFPIRQAIFANVALRKAKLLEVKGNRAVGGSVRAVPQGGACLLYAVEAGANHAALIDQVAATFQDAEGMSKVVRVPQFKAYGVADPKDDPHAPDLILFAKSGYSFGDTSAGELAVSAKSAELRGTHGHDPDEPDLHATFVAWGAGIKAGATLGNIDNTDVAPTLAVLLGLPTKEMDGKVLEGILEKPRP